LRERRDDIQLLLDHFLHTFVSRFKKPIKGFSTDAQRILLAYPYPGNVRELKNIVEYASNVCQDDQIQPEHLPAYLTNPMPLEPATGPVLPVSTGTPPTEKGPGEDLVDRAAIERKLILDAILKARQEKTEELEWPAIERKMIVDAIVKAQGRRSKAAVILGWSRSRLYRKMAQHGIET